ncbi:hypothetical protein SAMN04489761_0689 [Tenacibaculum sp. MAR_2009_124]|uniref:hypothetical protein n=1 Tax=Tenacibaculum sp. MAR_2009_124 TaxID=1250059 RepID=UPI000894C380|nr:hypothetical protein [Tenacibaculum sp. MAR_2009_124]SEB43402.1 hypothetical protein SAMN04489761_0689 [Tenacibaculum sp. MAR_2009_124]
MELINQDVYSLFLKYGSECLWKSYSRIRRPKGTNKTIDKMFRIIETVDHKFQMVYSGYYHDDLAEAD